MGNDLDELYFKDAFDLSSEGINLTVNNVSANCIASNNDTFSLDSEGNLFVKSIQALEAGNVEIDYSVILNMVYPVRSIYLSVNDTNPSLLFGGVWTRWGNGRTLVGVDTDQTEFNTIEKTGGTKILQKHNHYVSATLSGGAHIHRGRYRSMAAGNLFALRRISDQDSYEGDAEQINYLGGEHTHSLSVNTNNSGTGNSGNLQPYITCYMWKRVS